jgi:O-antigen polymerase
MKISYNTSIIIIITLLLMITPLVISSEILQGIMVMKYLYFNIIQAIVVVMGITYWLDKSNKTLYFNQTDVIISLLFLYYIIHYYSNSKPESVRFISFAAMLPLYWVVKQAIVRCSENRSTIVLIVLTILLVGDIQAIWGILQWSGILHSFNRYHALTGSFSNPSPMSIYMGMHLPLASVLLLSFRKPQNKFESFTKIFALISIGLICTILPITKSRTAWIMAFIGVGLVVFLLPNFQLFFRRITDTLTKRVALLTVTLSIIVLAGLFLYNFKKDSADGRLLIWKIGLSMVKENPLFGKGFDAVGKGYDKTQGDYFSSHKFNPNEIKLADQIGCVFNDYLHFSIEVGVVGLVLLLLLLFVIIKKHFKRNIENITNHNALIEHGLVVSVIIVFIAAFFTYPFQILPILLLFIVSIAIASGLSINQQQKTFHLDIPFLKLTALTIGIFWIISVSKQQIRFYNAYYLSEEAMLWNDEPKESLLFYKKALKECPQSGWILMQYGKCLATNNQHEESIKILNNAKVMITDTSLYRSLGDSYCVLKKYKEAEKCYQFAINIVPNKYYSRYNLLKFYIVTKDTLNARKIAYDIINMPVKISSKPILDLKQQMRVFINQSSKIAKDDKNNLVLK